MRSIVLVAVLVLMGFAVHAQPIGVDLATISMSAPGVPRVVTNTLCATDGNDLVCDRGAQLLPNGVISTTGLTVNGVSITGGGGVSRLASLTDVVASGAVSGSVLSFNAATSSWTALPLQQVMSTTTMLGGLPDAIQCTMGGGSSAIFYLAFSPFTDGRYYYRASEGVASSGSSIYTQIAFSSAGSYYGFYSTNVANSSAGNCAGKAISQLYAEGKAFNFIGSANPSGGTALGDRITSGTASGVIAMAGGTISFTTGGTSGTAYLDTLGRFVGAGVSTTGAVSAASVYAGASLQLTSPTAVTTCNSTAAGTIRYNSPTTTLELCTGSGWQPMGVGIPAGAISAFASTTCPTGWSEYTAARGRFLRGIDNGAGNDPSGTRAPGAAQADDLKSHAHPIYRRAWYANELIGGGTFFTPTGTSDNANVLMNTNATGGAETRPKNIAVTFCQFNGTSNGWNNPLSGGSTVAAGSTGQVQYNTAGSFDASPDISWSNGTKVLGVGGTVSSSKVSTNDVKLSDVGGSCSASDDLGRMFRNATTGRLQLCMPR